MNNKDYLEKIVELAEQNETRIIFVYVPYPTYQSIKNKNEFCDYLYEAIEEGYGKELLNYLQIDHDYSDEYFADYNHFNLKGAIKFSKEIGNKLTLCWQKTE